MNRGLEKRVIYRDDADRGTFLSLLGEVSVTFGIEIHAYSLMDNHYHLLIHTPQGQLGRAMRHLNGVYTQRFNKKWHRDGPLFRGRYKALLADETRLFELMRYIHLNPVTARIVRTADEHAWTSHRHYLTPKYKPAWLVTAELLRSFQDGKSDYRKSMDRFVTSAEATQLKKRCEARTFILGRSGFEDWLYRNHVTDAQKRDREHSRAQRESMTRPDPKRILEIVALSFDETVSALRCPSHGRRRIDRSVAIHLLRELTGMPHKKIALWLKCSNAYAVAKVVQRFKVDLDKDRNLQKQVEAIKRAVLSAVKT